MMGYLGGGMSYGSMYGSMVGSTANSALTEAEQARTELIQMRASLHRYAVANEALSFYP